MSWFTNYLSSSIGRKVTMALTGLFLIVFLLVHLVGNLQLLKDDGGEAFNTYGYFMTHNPLIKSVSYGLYFFIVFHTVQGLLLWRANRQAKGGSYAVRNNNPALTWAGQSMALLGTLILFFIVLHMGDFWLKMKMGVLENRTYEGYKEPIADLYGRCATAFHDPIYVGFYVLSMVVLYFHLSHGFQSAFQSLGWNHKKYTPLIKAVGTAYSILVPIGFAIIPIVFYFSK